MPVEHDKIQELQVGQQQRAVSLGIRFKYLDRSACLPLLLALFLAEKFPQLED